MNEARFQTAGHSALNIAEIASCWSTATAFVFWWPQLLKLDYGMSDTQQHIDATRHQNEGYLQIYVYGICTDFLSFRYGF